MAVAKKGKGGLGKWFGEEWTDVKTGKACGRKSAKGKSKRPYPACRPKKVASKITKSEAKKKTGPKRVKWSTTASGKKELAMSYGNMKKSTTKKSPFKVCKNCPTPAKCRKAKRCLGKKK